MKGLCLKTTCISKFINGDSLTVNLFYFNFFMLNLDNCKSTSSGVPKTTSNLEHGKVKDQSVLPFF